MKSFGYKIIFPSRILQRFFLLNIRSKINELRIFLVSREVLLSLDMIHVLLIILLIVFGYTYYKNRKFYKLLKDLPGPKWYPLVGSSYVFLPFPDSQGKNF
jgi:hypothetical protein